MLGTPGGEKGGVGFRGGSSSCGLWARGGKNGSCRTNPGKCHAALPLPPILFSTSLFGHLQWQLSSRRYGEGDAEGKLFQKERAAVLVLWAQPRACSPHGAERELLGGAVPGGVRLRPPDLTAEHRPAGTSRASSPSPPAWQSRRPPHGSRKPSGCVGGRVGSFPQLLLGRPRHPGCLGLSRLWRCKLSIPGSPSAPGKPGQSPLLCHQAAARTTKWII